MIDQQAASTGAVLLRDVTEADLPLFFAFQLDPDACRMAAFPARDREAFMAHWARVMGDEAIVKRTILLDGQVAGNIVSFGQPGETEVGYWLGREYWGRGVATRALAAFLGHAKTRPLFAHVAGHNVASIRVLEKCGFMVIGEEQGDPGPNGDAVREVVLQLGTTTGEDAP